MVVSILLIVVKVLLVIIFAGIAVVCFASYRKAREEKKFLVIAVLAGINSLLNLMAVILSLLTLYIELGGDKFF